MKSRIARWTIGMRAGKQARHSNDFSLLPHLFVVWGRLSRHEFSGMGMTMIRKLAIGLMLILLSPGRVPAQVSCELDKIVASDAMATLNFGVSVSLGKDVLVVGAYMGSGTGRGAAYVFDRATTDWVESQQLLPTDTLANDSEYGHSVSISGGTIVVGRSGDSTQGGFSGSAYVFGRQGASWLQTQKLYAPGPQFGAGFGHSVAVDGDTLVIGAPFESPIGAAYAFRFDGSAWVFEQELTITNPFADVVGYSVALAGDVALVSAIFDSEGGSTSGAVYVFRRVNGTWIEEQKLNRPMPQSDEQFGRNLALDTDVAVIGNSDESSSGGTGAAYVFRFDGALWELEQRVVPAGAAFADNVGSAVAVQGDLLVVGSLAGSDCQGTPGCISGTAYVFRHDGSSWVELSEITPSDAEQFDLFASHISTSIDVNDGIVAVGAPGRDDAGSGSGAAYVFAIEGDCNGNNIVDVCEIQAGSVEDADDDLIPDECPAMSFAGAITMLAALGSAGGIIVSMRSTRQRESAILRH